jgi:hypothetical protein
MAASSADLLICPLSTRLADTPEAMPRGACFGSYGVRMDIQSSVIFVAIVGLWLVWVGPYLLRFQRAGSLAEAGGPSMTFEPVPAIATGSGPQGIIMENTAHTGNTQPAPLRGSHAPAAAVRPAGPAPLKIRYGRTALALLGAAALVTLVIGGGLALFGAVSGSVPGFALLTVAAVVVVLRTLARRDRRRKAEARVSRAFEEAMGPMVPDEVPAAPRRETVLFDAAEGAEEPAAPAPLTAEELRAEARKVAVEAEAARRPEPETGTPWQPVEVPKPTYTQSAKVARPAPEPLPVPEEKKPTVKTPIKQAAVAPKVELPAAAPREERANRLNLDDVLQRRRA